MEPPVSSSRGPMGSLLWKLDWFESQRFLCNPVRKTFELLKEDLVGIDTFLLEISDEDDPNLMKKYWMKEVREICYDTEDYIDWLIHSELKIGSVGVVPRLKISGLPRTLNRRPNIASQIKELRGRLQDAGERHKRYILDNNTSPSSSNFVHSHWMQEWSRESASLLVGIDDSKEKLIKVLNNGEKQLNVISISGLGGIGKTTLAKQVLQELGWHFGCHAFVRASRKPDTRNLLRSILSQTGWRHHSEACNLQQLIDHLSEHLRHTRYLIVIDDLWDTTVWDFLLRAFPDGTQSSRIITTTASENVAVACCGNRSDYILKMEPLNDDDSRKLFLTRVFGSKDKCPQQLKDVSCEIVRKCGGVPLAVIHIAGLLTHQDKSEEWDYVERSLGSNLRISPTYEGMRKVINLSYNGLPQCLRTCLQYVSMYPENCTIWKDDLVRRWVAEGFIERDRERDNGEIAQSHFEELVYRGMIQAIDMNYNDQVLSCIVHPMVLDFVTNKSAEDNFITTVDYSQSTRELSSKIRRLFLFYHTAKYSAKFSGITLLQVRSLAFYGLVKCLPSIQEFKFLRVLVLCLWGDYNDSTILNLSGINRLFQLRYLKVTCNYILQLPTHMGGLHRLETMEINAKVTSVPEDIVYLKRLVHLSLPWETKLPYRVGRLRSLRTLKCFDFCGNSDNEVKSLQELSCLEELQLVLTRAPSDSVDRNLKVLFSILGCLYELKSLVVIRGASVSKDPVTIIDSSSTSCPKDCLERLELHSGTCILRSLPKWIGQLGNLCILKLGVLEILKNDVDSFAELQVLKFLSLYVRRPTAEPIIINSGAFPALEHFKLKSGVLCIAFRPSAMPKLHRLKLSFNAYSGVEFGGNMIDGIEHLLNLQEVSGRIGAAVGSKESDKRAAESKLKNAISNHSMIPRLNIQVVDWIEEDCVPAGDIMASKTQINKLSGDHGFLGEKSEVNTSKVDECRTSSLFLDAVVTARDVLNSDNKRKKSYLDVSKSTGTRLSTTDIRPSYSDKSFHGKIMVSGDMANHMKRMNKKLIEIKKQRRHLMALTLKHTIEKTVLGSLRLTYHLMAPTLKLCFAYCAIFAKGCEIDREELCHQWIALGLIVNPWKNRGTNENPGKTKRLAEEKIQELLDMSFLQDSGPSSVTIRSSGAPAKLKMHDLVHDLAKLVCDDELIIFNKNMSRTCGSPRYAMVFDCDKENLHKDNKLAGLRALHIKDCPTLKLIKWYNSSFAKRLKVLDISGHHIEKLPSSIGNLMQLRYLNASGIQCKELPKAIGTLSKLQYLNLHGSSISELPDSVTKLDQLMHLDISDCKNLLALPSTFGQLKCLCFLSLKNCYQLCLLPDDLDELQNLEILNLSGCFCLCKLPESIGMLKKLKHLDLSGCLKVTKLPDSFIRLAGLQYLNISSCSELNIPVDGLNKLVGLNYIDMSSCPKLVGLPEEFCSLEQLHTLNLSDCSQLGNLPEKLGQMKSIRFILLDGCAESVRKPILQHRLGAGLQSLPAFVIESQVGRIRSNITQLEQEKFSELELYRLENVRAVDEAEALKMPTRSELHSLGLMWTLNVRRFVEDEALLQALEPPENLQKFRVQGYMGERFPEWNVEIGSFRRGELDELGLMHFPMCNSLPQLGQLANLKKLHLCRMPKIRRLGRELGDDTGALKNLKSFTLECMENLEEWSTTMSMSSASSQHQLRPEGFMFPSLQELNIYHCPRLTMIPCPPRSIDWKVTASSRASQQLLEKDEAMQSLAEYMGMRQPFGYTTELHVNGSNSSSSHVPSDGWKFNASLITLTDLGRSDCCGLIDTLLAEGNNMQCLVNLEISGIEDTRSLLEQVETVAYDTRSSLAKSWPDWFPQQPILNSEASPHFIVSGFASCALDGWIEKVTSFLGNLIRINMEDLPMCERLPPLGQLPALQELRLKGMPKITRIDNRELCCGSSDRPSSSVFFPRLTKFVLNDMPNLEEWVITVSGSTISDHCGSDREEFMFPKLVKLTIWNCPELNLKRGLPRAEEWDINNSDRVITSSYDTNSGGGELATVLQVLSCKVAPNNWKLLYHLPGIQNLAIISCHGMEALPQSIQRLSSLQSLTVSKCHGLKHLPEWLGDLTSLHSLMVVSCPLEFLPGGMRRLSFLRSLTLSCCDRLAALPRWMGDLNSLVKITIEGCMRLKSLPQLNSLQYLLIDYNDELHSWCESGVNKAKFAGIKRQGFWLESHGRSNSYILPARSLYIVWGDDERYWRMLSHPQSRFAASMELIEVWWLEIEGNVPQGVLPASTSYDAYLVYKLADEHGLRWGESYVQVDGVLTFSAIVSFVDQDAVRVDGVAYPVTRSEGWMELRLGKFTLLDDSSTVKVQLCEKTDTYAKKGLIIEGMEIRAKNMPIT